MNIITILADRLNRNELSVYNCETEVCWPNIERLVNRSPKKGRPDEQWTRLGMYAPVAHVPELLAG